MKSFYDIIQKFQNIFISLKLLEGQIISSALFLKKESLKESIWVDSDCKKNLANNNLRHRNFIDFHKYPEKLYCKVSWLSKNEI